MLNFRPLRAFDAARVLACFVAVLGIVFGAMPPQQASAQSAGQFCPGEFAAGLPCNGPATATFTCPDGTVIYAGSACPSPVQPAVVQPAITPICAGAFAFTPACYAAPSTYVLPAASRVIPLPSYRYVLLTNTWSTTAAVSGADMVLAYDWSSGSYYQTSTLAPGQSAWAFSYNGGQAVLTALGY